MRKDKNWLKEQTLLVSSVFRKHFGDLGYIEYPPSSLVSSADHSVRFIGSTTNVFKSLLLYGGIPTPGFFLVQKCLRTQNAKVLLNDEIIPDWSSYFTATGIIAPPNRVAELFHDTCKYLYQLGIEKDRIRIDIASEDGDFISQIQSDQDTPKLNVVHGNIDTYRHRYGTQEIKGRNFNFSMINSKTGEFRVIGNIVLAENASSGKALAVELGFGVSTMISRVHDLGSSIEATAANLLAPIEGRYARKFSDALSCVVVILRENIKPSDRDKGRILKLYLQGLNYLKKKLSLTTEEVIHLANLYEKEEFGKATLATEWLTAHLEEYSSDEPQFSKQAKAEQGWRDFF
ncbi:MAG: hypothetical protein HYU81_02695 [Candidatus Brennerbacteria bacterium]|nr:hypothetical protein [Candidatus Brennerbacteria bacterium]